MKVVILGGGPTGLALAHYLGTKTDIPFELFERSGSLGGLAQTVAWKNYGKHDLGPHKIFTLNAELMSTVESLLPADEWIEREKKSRIFLKGHYLPYPPSPFSLLNVYGFGSFIKMVLDYGLAQILYPFRKNSAKSFQEDLEIRVGKSLYHLLFKPIAIKLWGDPSQLDSKLSKGRVQTPNPIEIIANVLKIKRTNSFEALTFKYPKGGLGKIWDSIELKTKGKGNYHRRKEVTRIETHKDRVSAIRLKDQQSGEDSVVSIEAEDYVFSTLPVKLLSKLMNTPALVTQTLNELCQMNDLLLVFLKIQQPSLLEDSWQFVPDEDIIFHRVSEQESFDPEMTPSGSIVCCEIMSSPERQMGLKKDEDLIAASIQDLEKMGYKNFAVNDAYVIRLPNSYPVFRPGFEKKLKETIFHFDKFENFKTIGRQGAFNYIGTLDAMDIGYGAGRWLVSSRSACWQEERVRTGHYPVLD